jgi:ribosome-associated protein
VTADLHDEIIFKTSRSSGPGGQNVNKVNSKVDLRFDVIRSAVLSSEEKEIILQKLKTRINLNGVLIVRSQVSRSQIKNKELALEKFDQLIRQALKPVIKRKPIRISRHLKRKRLEEKQKVSEKKNLRKPPEF